MGESCRILGNYFCQFLENVIRTAEERSEERFSSNRCCYFLRCNKNTVCLLKGESLARRRGGRCGRKMACYLWGTFLQNPYGQIRSLSWGKKSHFSRKTNKQTNKKHTYAPNKRASTHETLFQATK